MYKYNCMIQHHPRHHFNPHSVPVQITIHPNNIFELFRTFRACFVHILAFLCINAITAWAHSSDSHRSLRSSHSLLLTSCSFSLSAERHSCLDNASDWKCGEDIRYILAILQKNHELFLIKFILKCLWIKFYCITPRAFHIFYIFFH